MGVVPIMEKIIIKDASENNLKHLDLEIPLDKFTCVTGCSGCGKSSLVFDTIYAESQRAFLEGMTGNIYGQKLMNKPKVGSIENLRPALNISQNYYNVNPRSTIGTTTEISYYLRSLFSIVNSSQTSSVSEKLFSSNNPKSFCPHCFGLGVETVVSESLLIPDRDITLRDGAILYFKSIWKPYANIMESTLTKKSPNSAITSFASCFMLMTKSDANWPIKRANEKSSTM